MRLSVLLPLSALAGPAAFANPPATTQPADKVVCKKQLETGTLSKFNKVCMTNREWQRLRDMSAETGRGLRDKNFSSCSSDPTTGMPTC